jgi:hypothetical protein
MSGVLLTSLVMANVKAYSSPHDSQPMPPTRSTGFNITAKMNGPGLLCAAFALVGPATAQQFPGFYSPYEYFGTVSGTCLEAMNSTVDCVDQLANLHRYE